MITPPHTMRLLVVKREHMRSSPITTRSYVVGTFFEASDRDVRHTHTPPSSARTEEETGFIVDNVLG